MVAIVSMRDLEARYRRANLREAARSSIRKRSNTEATVTAQLTAQNFAPSDIEPAVKAAKAWWGRLKRTAANAKMRGGRHHAGRTR